MRPLELTLEGFRSYRERQTFQLESRGLFGIVGPTGAGKSSILDGLVYALFGRTNRLGRETTKLVNSSCENARVQLTFDVDSGVHKVTRVLRRKGNSQVTLEDEGGQLLASGERAANGLIEELVGLDFEAFCSSVVLPQGEFDRFLHATPSERSQILKKVFRLERVDAIRSLAKERLSSITADHARLEGQISSLGVTHEQIDETRSELTDAQARADSMSAAAKRVAEAEEAVRLGAERKAALDERIRDLSIVGSALPADDDLYEMAVVEERLHQQIEEAAQRKELAEKAYADAQREAEELEASTGVEVLSRAEALLDQKRSARSRIETLQRELQTAEQQTANLEVEIRSARADNEAARLQVAEARRELEAIVGRHSAMELRKHLEAGSQCPVCEQKVTAVPKVEQPPAVAAADKQLKAAEKRADAADRQLGELERKLASSKATLDHASSALKEANDLAEQLRSSVAQLLGVSDGFEEEVARLRSKIDASRKAVLESKERCEAAGSVLMDLSERAERSKSQRRTVAGHLIAACSKLGLEAPSVEDEAVMLRDAAKRVGEAIELSIQKANDQLQELDERLEGSEAALAAFRTQFSLRADITPQEAVMEAREMVATCKERLAVMEQRQRDQQEAVERLESLGGRRRVYERLCQDLTDSRFIAYLLDEQRRLLSDLGSERLYELTGRYRFDPDGTFEVVEEQTGARRSSNTLSGGEMFLASLALALALAEAVSQSGAPLKCFFLDEGFGSLDAASLDLALEGIESLATPGRIIGLISHVGGIQARLDDLIVLEKAEDGATVVAQHEGPISFGVASI